MFCLPPPLSGRVKLVSFMSQSCKDGYEMYKKVRWTCKTTYCFFAFFVAVRRRVAVVVAKAPYRPWSRYFTTMVTWRQPLQKAHYLMVSLRFDIQTNVTVLFSLFFLYELWILVHILMQSITVLIKNSWLWVFLIAPPFFLFGITDANVLRSFLIVRGQFLLEHFFS